MLANPFAPSTETLTSSRRTQYKNLRRHHDRIPATRSSTAGAQAAIAVGSTPAIAARWWKPARQRPRCPWASRRPTTRDSTPFPLRRSRKRTNLDDYRERFGVLPWERAGPPARGVDGGVRGHRGSQAGVAGRPGPALHANAQGSLQHVPATRVSGTVGSAMTWWVAAASSLRRLVADVAPAAPENGRRGADQYVGT